jgi:hypothetical protein
VLFFLWEKYVCLLVVSRVAKTRPVLWNVSTRYKGGVISVRSAAGKEPSWASGKFLFIENPFEPGGKISPITYPIYPFESPQQSWCAALAFSMVSLSFGVASPGKDVANVQHSGPRWGTFGMLKRQHLSTMAFASPIHF